MQNLPNSSRRKEFFYKFFNGIEKKKMLIKISANGINWYGQVLRVSMLITLAHESVHGREEE